MWTGRALCGFVPYTAIHRDKQVFLPRKGSKSLVFDFEDSSNNVKDEETNQVAGLAKR